VTFTQVNGNSYFDLATLTHAPVIEYRETMYHQAPDVDSDFVRTWTLIHELSDQLAHNQKMISTLASQAGLLQVRAFRKPKALSGLCV